MNVLLVGNQGYLGAVMTHYLLGQGITITGLDCGYFAHCLSNAQESFPDIMLKSQVYKDVRHLEASDFYGYEGVVYLAAISNDPMGKVFEEPTTEINQQAAIRAATLAKQQGVRAFVFASSCSVYGSAGDHKRSESAVLNPLTAYARSKIGAENVLKTLASPQFMVTSLRFATACGFSPRLRLDLVLNDFVACATSKGKIEILSDGTPWRPLIHVQDMARAVEWALQRNKEDDFLAINTGSDEWNYQVRTLANTVALEVSGTTVNVNTDAQVDKRSYQVDFSLFKRLAPKHQPQFSLKRAIHDLYHGLKKMGFDSTSFHQSPTLIRLNTLKAHQTAGRLDNQLFWN